MVLKRCEELLKAGRYQEALDTSAAVEPTDPRVATAAEDARIAVEYGEIRRLDTGRSRVRALAFRPGDGRLAVATAAGGLQLWDARRGRFGEPAWERKPSDRPPAAVSLSEDGHWAAVASGATIELIDLDSPETAPRKIASPATCSALAVAPGPEGTPRLAAGDRRGSAWTWTSTGRDAAPVFLASSSSLPVAQVALSRDGAVAIGRESGPVELHRPRNGSFAPLPLSDRNSSVRRRTVTSLAFSPDGLTVLAGRDAGTIASWRLTSDGLSMCDKPMERDVTDMTFSDDGTLFAAASEDRRICIGFNRTRTGSPIFVPTLIPGSHRDAVSALAFDGTATLATGGADGTVKLWSLERGKLAAAVGKDER